MKKQIAGLSLLALVTACSGGGGSTPAPGTSTLSVALVDAPFAMSGATVTAVNLGILKVEVVGAGQPTVVASFTSPDVVNILNYPNATSALTFPTATIPAGSYQQVRFVVDTATTTISYTDSTGSHSAALTIPSGTIGGFGNASSTDNGDGQGTSGFKVNAPFTAVAGSTYGFIIDFNAAQSIVQTGNAMFILKPVTVATAVAISGSLTGTVKNNAGLAVANAEVDAQQGGVTINSGLTDANGAFNINALPAGSYTLIVKNMYTTLAGESVTATNADSTANVTGPTVTVINGTATNVGTITD